MKIKFLHKIRKTKGNTLGEMLVCVALVGLISSMACTAILMSYQRIHDMQQATYRQQLGTTLMSRIIEELSEATNDPEKVESKTVLFYTSDPSPASEKDQEGNILTSSNMRDGSTQIIFRDSVGIRTRIYVNRENQLEIWYQESLDSEKTVPDSYWTFAKEAYHGYEIGDLQFEFLSDSAEYAEQAFIRVTLKLQKEDGQSEETFTGSTACYMVLSNVVGG